MTKYPFVVPYTSAKELEQITSIGLSKGFSRSVAYDPQPSDKYVIFDVSTKTFITAHKRGYSNRYRETNIYGVANLLSVDSTYLTINEVDLHVEFDFTKGRPATTIDPAEDPFIELRTVNVGGIDIAPLLSDDMIDEIENAIIEKGYE